MASKRWRHALPRLVLFVLLLTPIAVEAGPGVIWLTADSHGDAREARVRIPLEWLANADREGHSEIRFDEGSINCTQLWEENRDLPIGQSREIRRGVCDVGDEYIVRVVSEEPSARRAEGRVHILSWDREGKSSDVRFPLDLTGLLQQIGSFIAAFFGDKSADHSSGRHNGVDIEHPGDLRKLADYGPFVFLRSKDRDGGKVQISIE